MAQTFNIYIVIRLNPYMVCIYTFKLSLHRMDDKIHISLYYKRSILFKNCVNMFGSQSQLYTTSCMNFSKLLNLVSSSML